MSRPTATDGQPDESRHHADRALHLRDRRMQIHEPTPEPAWIESQHQRTHDAARRELRADRGLHKLPHAYQVEKHDADRRRHGTFILALGHWRAVAGGFAIIGAARRLRQPDPAEFGDDPVNEQAITVKAPLEIVEAAWVEWCAWDDDAGSDYAVRFEPAPGARGTEVHRRQRTLRRFGA